MVHRMTLIEETATGELIGSFTSIPVTSSVIVKFQQVPRAAAVSTMIHSFSPVDNAAPAGKLLDVQLPFLLETLTWAFPSLEALEFLLIFTMIFRVTFAFLPSGGK